MSSNARTDCPPDPVLFALAEGRLEGEGARAALHLGECEECRERAVEYRALGDAVGSLDASDAVRWDALESPFGRAFLAATRHGLARLSWTGEHDAGSFRRHLEESFPERPVVRGGGRLAEARREVEEYFEGRRSSFDFPVDLTVLSDFERQVLGTLWEEVSFGEVIPYAELARRIGRPRAARAVGNALGRNPVAIVIPCHRVIRSDGSLGGYMGGLRFKRHLLALEGREDLLAAG